MVLYYVKLRKAYNVKECHHSTCSGYGNPAFQASEHAHCYITCITMVAVLGMISLDIHHCAIIAFCLPACFLEEVRTLDLKSINYRLLQLNYFLYMEFPFITDIFIFNELFGHFLPSYTRMSYRLT